MKKTSSHTDIKTGGWITELLPPVTRPYALLMRLDRPIGTWLLLLPAWWSILMASAEFDSKTATSLFLFAIGSVLMRGAGCVINDLWDKDFDKNVERTKNRPLACGQISPRQALVFLLCLLILSLAILLSFNLATIILGAASLIPVILYPLAKRITWYPQAVLGLTFNIGALMGATAILGYIPAFAWGFYAAGFFWTMGYDTIYARQDIADDALIGIKSTARKFGHHIKIYSAIFYGITSILLILTGLFAAAGLSYFIGCGLAIAHLAWQITQWQTDNPASSLAIFRSNRDYALIITAAIFFDLWF